MCIYIANRQSLLRYKSCDHSWHCYSLSFEYTLSCPTLSYLVLSCPILSYLVLSCPILSYLVLSCPILSYLVLFCLILFYVVDKLIHTSASSGKCYWIPEESASWSSASAQCLRYGMKLATILDEETQIYLQNIVDVTCKSGGGGVSESLVFSFQPLLLIQ